MPADSREQRLAAKLRENLRRRKQQAKARSVVANTPDGESDAPHQTSGGAAAALPDGDDSDS